MKASSGAVSVHAHEYSCLCVHWHAFGCMHLDMIMSPMYECKNVLGLERLGEVLRGSRNGCACAERQRASCSLQWECLDAEVAVGSQCSLLEQRGLELGV